MISDILPTSFQCGCLSGKVESGTTVAIMGCGPINVAALLTTQQYSAATIIAIEIDMHRLEVASQFGATRALDIVARVPPTFLVCRLVVQEHCHDNRPG